MDQSFIDLYDQYTHTEMGRGPFLRRLAKLAGGAAAARAMLPLLDVNYGQPGLVAEDDEGIITGETIFGGPEGDVMAYSARPSDGKRHPGVVVIHENRGLNPHIKDVTRRVAAAGFIALAPDALSPLGGTPEDRDEARSLIYKLDAGATLGNYLAAVDSLRKDPQGTGKVGCMGFCWGGGMANQLAVHDTQLKAAVAFYGRQPDEGDTGKIKAALLLHYAGLDSRINSGIGAYEKALKENRVDYAIHMYEGVNHAFHNDTAPTRYDEEAAKLAWQRTIDFLNEHLS